MKSSQVINRFNTEYKSDVSDIQVMVFRVVTPCSDVAEDVAMRTTTT
jgi:hypothetical protein